MDYIANYSSSIDRKIWHGCNLIKRKDMEAKIQIFETPLELANFFAQEIRAMVLDAQNKKKTMNMAISGGSTPGVLFNVLASEFSNSIPWKSVHFFWADERCVPSDHPESNYGVSFSILFSKIQIPSENIHRIRGEADPQIEVVRYASEINSLIPKENHIARFDLIILGLGEDGHTASIFPNQMGILQSDNTCEIAVHPQSGQKRISLTGKVINSAGMVVFLVTGSNKSRIARSVINERKQFFPASHIKPINGKLSWLLDKSVARGL
jgi:6-phosphogluconolactonase